MIRLLVLLGLLMAVAAIVAPGVREALAWVLAFLSLLMLGELVRGSFARYRGTRSHGAITPSPSALEPHG